MDDLNLAAHFLIV